MKNYLQIFLMSLLIVFIITGCKKDSNINDDKQNPNINPTDTNYYQKLTLYNSVVSADKVGLLAKISFKDKNVFAMGKFDNTGFANDIYSLITEDNLKNKVVFCENSDHLIGLIYSVDITGQKNNVLTRLTYQNNNMARADVYTNFDWSEMTGKVKYSFMLGDNGVTEVSPTIKSNKIKKDNDIAELIGYNHTNQQFRTMNMSNEKDGLLEKFNQTCEDFIKLRTHFRIDLVWKVIDFLKGKKEPEAEKAGKDLEKNKDSYFDVEKYKVRFGDENTEVGKEDETTTVNDELAADTKDENGSEITEKITYKFEYVSGNGQSGYVGQVLAEPFTVKITYGETGKPVEGIDVMFKPIGFAGAAKFRRTVETGIASLALSFPDVTPGTIWMEATAVGIGADQGGKAVMFSATVKVEPEVYMDFTISGDLSKDIKGKSIDYGEDAVYKYFGIEGGTDYLIGSDMKFMDNISLSFPSANNNTFNTVLIKTYNNKEFGCSYTEVSTTNWTRKVYSTISGFSGTCTIEKRENNYITGTFEAEMCLWVGNTQQLDKKIKATGKFRVKKVK